MEIKLERGWMWGRKTWRVEINSKIYEAITKEKLIEKLSKEVEKNVRNK